MKRGRTPALTEAQVADVRKMKANKSSVAQIADAYGVNHVTIRRALQPGYNGVPIPEDKLPELRKMYDAGETLVAISKHFETSQTTVRKAIKKLGLETIRKRDEKMRGTPERRDPSQIVGRRDEWKVRINDYPDSLTAAAFGDPTPQRRRLMEEGRI